LGPQGFENPFLAETKEEEEEMNGGTDKVIT
jgi:hypothetical protein